MFRESQTIGLYTLIRKLGQGGFGEVWLAENRRNSPTEKVAIKLPRNDQIDLQAVKDEIFNWTLSGKHKNILPIIECETFGNQIAIVSEFASDGSLKDLLEKHPLFSATDSVEYIIGVLDGLTHLHNRQIIHRDLKPDNVLFQGRIPRLTDFGISRAMSIDSQSQTVSGTLSYMAPEALDGKRNAQTDIWSVGVMFYQLLTGNLPFPQNGLIELIGALATKEPETLPNTIPPALQEIVMKSLAKEPTKRYQTADEMAKDLRQFSQGKADETLKIPLYHDAPTKVSPEIVKTVPTNLNSVETELKVPIKTDETPTHTYPVSSPTKPKKNLLYFAIPSVILLFAIIGSYLFINKSGNTTANVNTKSIPSITSTPTLNTVSDITLIPFRKGDKFGFCDFNKKLIIEAKYEDVKPFHDGLAIVKLKGKYGGIDKMGSEIITFKYDTISSFVDDLAFVKLNDKEGLINKSGKEIVSPIYDNVTFIGEGLVTVKQGNIKSGKEVVIDKTGNVVFPINFDRVSNFDEGLAVVELNDKSGFIDKTGKEIIPLKYDFASGFSEGLSDVELNDKWGFINKTGSEVIPLKYDAAHSFNEGLARVKLNEKWGFIDKTGKEIIPLKYDEVDTFEEGLAKVKINNKYGFIDKMDNLIIPFKYDNANSFSEDGLAAVSINDKSGFINKTGKEVIALKYEMVLSFNEGLAAVKLNDKIGFIDKLGNEVIQFKYSWRDIIKDLIDKYSFENGLSRVRLSDKEFYIDKNGTEYYEP